MKRPIKPRQFSQQMMTVMRTRLRMPVTLLMLVSTLTGPFQGRAAVIVKTNAGANTLLAFPTVSGVATNAQNTALTASDILSFNNAITAASTYRVSNVANSILNLNGLRMLNPAGAITLQNSDNQSQTINLGSGGIDLSTATQNLTLSNAAGGTLTLSTSAVQDWSVLNVRTLALSNSLVLNHQVNLNFLGGNTGGTAGVVNLTGTIGGAGNLNIAGMIGGSGGSVTISGNNSSWTGAVTVGGGATLNIDTGTTAGQSRLSDLQALTINRGIVSLTNNSANQVESVGSVVLGSGLNQLLRASSSASTRLNANAISRTSPGAVLNVGNIGTTAGTSHLLTDNLNVNNMLGTWAVAINSTIDANWVKNGPNTADGGVIALSGTDYTTQNTINNWTTPSQHILVTSTTTAGTASRTIGSLKISTAATAATVSLGSNTLTINDGQNGGGIIRVGNGTTLIGTTSVNTGFLTAGAASDGNADTLRIFNLQNTLAVNNIIQNNGSDPLHVVLGAPGTVVFNSQNTYTGSTTIANGILTLGNNTTTAGQNGDVATLGTGPVNNFGTLTVNKTASVSGANAIIANSIAGTGSLTLNRGVITLSGTNTYSGDTNLLNSSGAATFRVGSADAVSPDSRFVLNAASVVLDLNNISSTAAALRGDQATASVTLGSGTLTLSGSDNAKSGTNDRLLSTTTQIYAGVISGSGGLVKNGAFTQQLNGAGALSYTGTTTVNNGILRVGKAMASSNLVINGGTFISDVSNVLADTASVNLAGAGAVLQMINGTSDTIGSLSGVENTALLLNSGNSTTTLTINDASGIQKNFDGVITMSTNASVGAGNLVKSGGAAWILGGGNAYNGSTTINNGVLRIKSQALVEVIPDLSPLIIASTAGAIFDVNGKTETIGSLAGGGASGGEVSLGIVGKLSVGANNTSTTYSGEVSGLSASELIKIGTGNLTLNGTSSNFSGQLTISGGTLTLANVSGNTLSPNARVLVNGLGATLAVAQSQSLSGLTLAQNTTLSLSSGATLTTAQSSNSTVVLPVAMDADTRVIRITGSTGTMDLKPGMMVSGAEVPAGTYIVQILSDNQVLVNRTLVNAPTGQNISFTEVGQVAGNLTGAGNWTKTGTGTVVMSGSNTLTGTVTIGDGILQVGGIAQGGRNLFQDILSDQSTVAFGNTGTPTLNLADNVINLIPFERTGGLAGGSNGAVINLTNGSSQSILSFGTNNSNTEFTGSIRGSTTAWLIKEGTGTSIWNANVDDSLTGTIRVDGGGLTVRGLQGLSNLSNVVLSNRAGATLTLEATGTEELSFISGGGRGATRTFSNGLAGALLGNYLSGVGGNIVINGDNLSLTNNTANALYVYGGALSGTGGLFKQGNNTLEVRGVNSYAGRTTLQSSDSDNSLNVIRLGAYSASAGVGNLGSGGFGSLPSTTRLQMVVSNAANAVNRNLLFDLNGGTQTLAALGSQNIFGTKTVQFGGGTLNIQTAAPEFSSFYDGVFSGVGTINVLATQPLPGTPDSGWDLQGNSNATQRGNFNIQGGIVSLNRNQGTLGDSVHVNIGAAGRLKVVQADTVGSLSGAGQLALTQTLRLSSGPQGSIFANSWSGTTSGAGGITLLSGASLRMTSTQNYQGATTLSNGSALFLDYSAGTTNILPDVGGALVLNGGNIYIRGSTTTDSATSTTISGGAASISNQISLPAARLGLGNITYTSGGSLLIRGSSAHTTTAAQQNLGILGGYAVYQAVNANGEPVVSWAVPQSGGNAISGLETFSTVFGANASTSNIDVSASNTGASNLISGQVGSLRFNRPEVVEMHLDVTPLEILSGGILVTPNVGANDILITGSGFGESITGGFGSDHAVTNELIIHQYNTLGNLTLNVPVSDFAGNTRLTKTGPGRLIIAADNFNNGQTSILGGVLQVGEGGASGSLGANSQDIINHGYLAVNRGFALTISNSITGTGAVRSEGFSRLRLSGSNSNYTGPTQVITGSIQAASSSNALGSIDGLTSVSPGATLELTSIINVPEMIYLKGGTLTSLNGASSISGPVVLGTNSFVRGDFSGLTISGPLTSYPGRLLTHNGVGSLILTNASNQLGNIRLSSDAKLQIGNNSAGSVGRGIIEMLSANNSVITNTNNGHLVLSAKLTGLGGLTQVRNTVYLAADNTYTGLTTVGSETQNAELRVGNDTYTGSLGTGAVVVQSSIAGNSNIRFHKIQDVVVPNNITLNPWTSDAATNRTARNTTLLRQGLGNVTLSGTITAGSHVTGPAGGIPAGTPNTQRGILQTEAGGRLIITGTISNTTDSRLNIINNGMVEIAGDQSNTYEGVLSGGGIYVFNNSGTTTLRDVNTFSSANTYIQRGTVIIDNPPPVGAPNLPPVGDGLQNDNDQHVLRGATLQFNHNETIGGLFTQRGATVSIAADKTLTIDDNINHALYGRITGQGSVNFNASGGAAWYGLFSTGNLATESNFTTVPIIGSASQTTTVRVDRLPNGGIASPLGTNSTIQLGLQFSAEEARFEYIGSGESSNRNFNLVGGAVTPLAKTTGDDTNESNSVELVDVDSVAVGMIVVGGGVPDGTVVTGIDTETKTITLNQDASIPLATLLKFYLLARTTRENATATNIVPMNAVNGITEGMLLEASGVPVNTFVNSINVPELTITLNNNVTLGAGATIRFYNLTTTVDAIVRIAGNGSGALNLQGDINNQNAGNKTVILHGQNTLGNTISGVINQKGTSGTETGVISLTVNPKVGDNDLYGAGLWKLTNPANNFSGRVTVGVGTLELVNGLGDGTGITSVLGDLSVPRVIDLGTNDFNGRRYDIFGNGDNLGAGGGLTSTGSLIFNDQEAGTATFGSNITFTQSFSSTTNPGNGRLVNNGNKVIVINGALTSGQSGDRSWILDGTNTGINTINGSISSGLNSSLQVSNNVGIIKNGPGTWRIANSANSMTGTVTVNRGLLEIQGGASIGDGALVNLANAGSDGSSVGAATLRFFSGETFGGLAGAIGTSLIADTGLLTLTNANQTFSGVISGGAGLVRTNNDGNARIQTLTNINTYSGSTSIITNGVNNVGNRLDVYYLADGGSPSSIGQSSNAASNLVINTVNANGGLRYLGFTPQTTDRLLTLGASASATTTAAPVAIWADGTTVAGAAIPSISFTNTGPVAFTSSNLASTLMLRGQNVGNNTFNPQITNNGSGVVNVTKIEQGTWVLGGNNTFTGAVNILTGVNSSGTTTTTGGTLVVTHDNALGTSAGGVNIGQFPGTAVAGGGSGTGLMLRGGRTITGENLTLNISDAALTADSGVNTWTGNVSLNVTNSNLRIAAATNSSLNISGAITGAFGTGRLLLLDHGIRILSGANTYTGITSMSGGTVRLDYSTSDTSKLADASALELGWFGGSNGIQTLLGVDADVPTQLYQVATSGVILELSGGSHAELVSGLTLNQGASRIQRASGSSATLLINGITRSVGNGVNDYGTLDFGSNGLAATTTANAGSGANAILAGYATVNRTDWAIAENVVVGTNVAAVATTDRINAPGFANGTPVRFTANAPAGLSLNTNYFVVNATGSDFQLATTIGGTPLNITADGATATLARTGVINAVAAAAYNNNLGVTTFGNGINTDVLAAGFGITVSDLTVTQTVRFNDATGGTLTLAGTLGLEQGAILMTPNSGPVTINGGVIRRSAATGNLDLIFNNQSTNTLTVNSIIQNNSGALALTKTGPGTLILGGANTQTARVNIQQGILQVGDGTPGTVAAKVGATNLPFSISHGAELRINVADAASIYDTSTISGGGTLRLASTNTSIFLLNDDHGNWVGDTFVDGGTLRFSGNNIGSVLGNLRGTTTVNSGGILQAFGALTATSGTITPMQEWVTFNEGSTFSAIANGSTNNLLTMSGHMTLNNLSSAGFVVNFDAGQSVTWSGLVEGSNGFTKRGDGVFTLSGNNYVGNLVGQTAVSGTAALLGQIIVEKGDLRIGNARALGAVGVGHETIVLAGGSLDLRGQSLNFGDDSLASREIIRIIGQGSSSTGEAREATGALKNTSGAGVASHLVLTGNATVSGGGFNNGASLRMDPYDINPNTGSALDGNVTFVSPTITSDGGTFTLTKIGTGDFDIRDASLTNLDGIVVREGRFRWLRNNPPNVGAGALTPATVGTKGIEVGYGGPSLGDHTNSSLGLGPIVAARLDLFRNVDVHHTAKITLDGALAESNRGHNYLEVSGDTLPIRTYLDGVLELKGVANASRNIISVEANGGTNTVVEQGNLTGQVQGKLIVNGEITGAGGFTKIGLRELRLTSNNTFTGNVNVLRFGSQATVSQSSPVTVNGVDVATYGEGESWGEWGLTLFGQGTLANAGNINLQRRGMITLDNTNRLAASSGSAGANLSNRINDSSNILLNHGWLRIHGNALGTTESLATSDNARVQLLGGTNMIDLWPEENAGNQDLTLKIGQIDRSAGSVLRITNFDATSTFAGALPAEPTTDSVRVELTTLGTLNEVGSGAGATSRKIVHGILGGNIPHTYLEDLRSLVFNNTNTGASDLYNQGRNLQFLAGSHFMTYDTSSGTGYLRPLDDSEYFTPTDGVLDARVNGAAGQNVNLTDNFTILKENVSINALRFGPAADHDGSGNAINNGTTLTSYVGGHNVQLYVDGTLNISSGMISSAYFTVGNSSSLATFIMGGNVNFGSNEGIINNQNGMVNLTNGTISTGNLEIRSNILGNNGLIKTGLAQVVFDGRNAYAGVTTVSEGNLFLRNGRSALGIGGAGNGVYLLGSANLFAGNGIQIGSEGAGEDILVGALQGDQNILRSDNDLTNFFGDIIIDNVDAAGMTLFTPRLSVNTNASLIINGDIYGGPSAVTNDVSQIDSRILTTNGSGDGYLFIRGNIGDRGIGGSAAPVADRVSTLETLSGTRTNENEVFRFQITGADSLNVNIEDQYRAAGRLSMERGVLVVNYDPAALPSGDRGFWSNAAIASIANADSNSNFALNGNTSQHGFVLGNGGVAALFLNKADQVFNMSSWRVSSASGSTAWIGGLNETGVVTFGTGNGSLGLDKQLRIYSAGGGTVNLNMRLNGNSIIKNGRGTLVLQNTNLNSGSDTNTFELGGGTVIADHGGLNVSRLGTAGNFTFRGGVLQTRSNTTALTNANYSTDTGGTRTVSFLAGGNEIVAEAFGQNMTLTLGNSSNNSLVNRAAGASANFVAWQNGAGTARINLNFSAVNTAAVKNRAISWATYSTTPRTALDFAMVDNGNGNIVGSYARAPEEFQNNVNLWSNGMDVSENGGVGFNGTRSSNVTLNTLRFDALADSALNMSSYSTLLVAGDGIAGGVLVSSNTGSTNKTITGDPIVTRSNKLDAFFNTARTGNIASGANQITNVVTTGLSAGMIVSGPGLPIGTAVVSVTANSITLSARSTVATTGGTFTVNTFLGNTTANTNTISGLTSTAGLTVGMPIRGVTHVTRVIINSSGSNYSSPPTVTISGGGGSGATAVATVSGGAVTSVILTNPGTGYTSVPTIGFSGGSGSGASAVAFVPAAHFPTDALITSVASNSITISSNATLTGSGVALEPITSTAGGAIAAYSTKLDPLYNTVRSGDLAADANQITNVITTGLSAGMLVSGPGLPTGTAVVSVTANTITLSANSTVASTGGAFNVNTYIGNTTINTNTISGLATTAGLTIGMPIRGATHVTRVIMNSGGSNYSTAPTVSISGGGGSGAEARAIVSGGAVTAVVLTNPGTGYTSVPTIGFSGGNGSGAAAVAFVPAAHFPTNVTITGVTSNSVTISSNATLTGSAIALETSTPDLLFHHYGQGDLTIASEIKSDNAVTVTGPSTTLPNQFNTTGTVRFTGNNTYTGRTYVTGGVLEINNANALGAAPTSVSNNHLTLNGGTLRWSGGVGSLGTRGVRLEGSGGVIEVEKSDGNLIIGTGVTGTQAQIVSEDLYRGDLIKTGPGALTLMGSNTGHNSGFQGLLDIREGSLIVMVDTGNGGVGTTSILGTNRTWADGTIFRTGTNFQAFLGNGNNTGEWNIDEFITFEGNNTFTYSGLIDINSNLAASGVLDGQLNLSNRRTLNFNGVMNIAGTTTFDIGFASNVRLNNNSGYLTGSGDLIKDGQGQLEFRANVPDWKGGLVIKQGTVYALNQADVLGTGYKTGKTITLGDSARQGTAQLLIQNPDGIQNWIFEIGHDIDVTYNPAQTKRLGFDNVANGNLVSLNGNITLNDNLIVLLQDSGTSTGGEQAILNFNGNLRDGAQTSGNIVFQGTDNGGANDNTSGRTVSYAVLNGNNSLWTGDVTIGANTSYDQDKTTVLRLGNSQALTGLNDVTMNFNSILQAGGQNVTIGSLTTQGGVGGFYGDTTMSASSNGSSEIIENASSTPGTLTISQTTPNTFEAAWDAYFRDGTPNSQFFAPGTNSHLQSGALSLVKSGSGWSTLTLDNNYTGSTTVAAGILQVGRNGVGDTGGTTASGTTVNLGAIIAGTGIVQGQLNLLSGATVRPGDMAGNSIGTLTVAGDAIFASGATALMQVRLPSYNNPTALSASDPLYATWIDMVTGDTFANALEDLVTTSQHDMVNSLGTINWTPGSKVTLQNEGYTPKAGDIFKLFKGQGYAGTINVGPSIRTGDETGLDLTLFPLGGNFRWDVSKFNTDGILVVVEAEGAVNIPLAPVITSGPTSDSSGVLEPGTFVNLTVTATGSGTLSYQWYRNDVAVTFGTGAQTNSLEIQATTDTKGVYTVAVTNAGGTTRSANSVTVNVNDSLFIASNGQPQSLIRNPNESATFSVTVSGPGPVSYQWRKDGVDLEDGNEISGAESNQLTINPTSQANEGIYTVVATNPAGSITSAAVTLTVNDPISQVAVTRIPSASNVYVGDTIDFTVTHLGVAKGVGTATGYQWFKDGSALSGKTASTLRLTNIATSASGTYSVEVRNDINSASGSVGLNVLAAAPSVTTHPISQVLLSGEPLVLEVAANGKPNLKYQWKRNNAAIAGATSATYTVPAATIANGGTYVCDVSNTTRTTSNPARIVVVDNNTKLVPIVETTGTASLTANVGMPTTGTTLTYQWFRNGVAVVNQGTRVTGANLKILKITKATLADDGDYTCRVIASGFTGTDYAAGVVGCPHQVRVFNEKPEILKPFTFPVGTIGANYSFEVPIARDADSHKKTPSSVTATGLPTGLKIDALTGVISGRPTTAPKVGGYTVKITASNTKGKDEFTANLLIKAQPENVAGNYIGLVARNSDTNLGSGLGGRVEFSVTALAKVTGKVILGTSSFAFTADLNVDVDDIAPPNVAVKVKRTGTLAPLDLSFTIDKDNQLVTGSIQIDGQTVSFNGWRQKWNLLTAPATASPATAYVGYYTYGFGLADGDPLLNGNTVPHGSGYASFTVAKDGKLTFAGKTPDGESLTGGTFIGPSGQMLVYQTLYTTTVKGSIHGNMNINAGGGTNNINNTLTGNLTWVRPPATLASARTYRAGFGLTTPVAVTVVGGRYAPPTTALLILDIPAPGGTNNAKLVFSSGGITTVERNPNITFSIGDKGKITLPPTGVNNPAATRFTLTATSGAISGGFSLDDANPVPNSLPLRIKRTATYQGLIVREGGEYVGVGYFLLPQLPSPGFTATTSPILSGSVLFDRAP